MEQLVHSELTGKIIGYRSIGKRRVDFFVESAIMVEIEALTKLEDVHLAQAIASLEASRREIGLLLNFGRRSLDFKRVLNHPKKRPAS